MNIDYSKPIIDNGPSENLTERHLRVCNNCGQRFALYGDSTFQTMLMVFRNAMKCPCCDSPGPGEPYNEDYQFKTN